MDWSVMIPAILTAGIFLIAFLSLLLVSFQAMLNPIKENQGRLSAEIKEIQTRFEKAQKETQNRFEKAQKETQTSFSEEIRELKEVIFSYQKNRSKSNP